MKAFLKLASLGFALTLISICSALAVREDESASIPTADSVIETYDPAVLEQYKPTEAERMLHPDKLWYFDHPDLFLNPAHDYYLTNDFGASAPYLVEASNTTHWDLQLEQHESSPTSLSTRAISYINAYTEGACIGDSISEQNPNPTNSECWEWDSLWVLSLFVVGSGNFQVNIYGPGGANCDKRYLGSVKNWSGCWTSASRTDYELGSGDWDC
ncbi:hypothetical protein HK57_00258 [Aspergillus ustus]|uniref:Secreted protein n=1 Tax=Aspergillus ustus TaxID=40382 RepID=A0A0C1BWI7_ASPUT|nr:hypothetical protein HK57_00258 [Aspergillus ustus]